MIKTYQTLVNNTNGDCMRAALASLLEMKLKDVPNLVEYENWGQIYLDFLKDNGYNEVNMLFNENENEGVIKEYSLEVLSNYNGVKGCFYASVYSPKYFNDGGTHAVIIDKNYNIIHDPNPNNKGLQKYPLADKIGYNGIKQIWIIEKLNSAKA